MVFGRTVFCIQKKYMLVVLTVEHMQVRDEISSVLVHPLDEYKIVWRKPD